MYRQRAAPVAGARHTPFLSMVTDLSVEEDAITDQFGKDCRYKIRRAETKDGLSMEFITDPEGRLDEFRAFFDAFARQKSRRARRSSMAGCRLRSPPARAHVGLAERRGAGLARLRHCREEPQGSSTPARASETGTSDYRALVGRANRWLHWRDMLQFKEMGIARYDWGGLFEDESDRSAPASTTSKRTSAGGQYAPTTAPYR